jgi:hypothetical protein
MARASRIYDIALLSLITSAVVYVMLRNAPPAPHLDKAKLYACRQADWFVVKILPNLLLDVGQNPVSPTTNNASDISALKDASNHAYTNANHPR